MFLKVIRVQPLDGYRLRVEFNDRSVKEVDLRDQLYGEAFEPLKRPEYFRQVVVNPETETIEWPNGVDFAPEFLHRIGTDARRIA
jgi:hypothetical protein